MIPKTGIQQIRHIDGKYYELEEELLYSLGIA